MGDPLLKIMGTIDLLAVLILAFMDLWLPLKVIIMAKLLYSGSISFLG